MIRRYKLSEYHGVAIDRITGEVIPNNTYVIYDSDDTFHPIQDLYWIAQIYVNHLNNDHELYNQELKRYLKNYSLR